MAAMLGSQGVTWLGVALREERGHYLHCSHEG